MFLEEANPDEWPGAGIKLAAMDTQSRGDRYWSKRNAAATSVLATRVATMIGTAQQLGSTPPPSATEGDDGEGDLERELVSAEHEAARLMNRLHKRHGNGQA